jgi:DNA invertase Pin-like site-specific DNA recombinase
VAIKGQRLPRAQAREQMKHLPTAQYLRVSSEQQAKKYGPDSQRQDVADACAQLGLQEPTFSFEDHISAAGEMTRTDFERSLTYAQEGRYKMLIVGRVDRFARNEQQAWNYLDQLISSGAVVYFTDEDVAAGLDEDWEDAVSGKISSAAAISRLISKNVRKANRQRVLRGERLGKVPWFMTLGADGKPDFDPKHLPLILQAVGRVLKNDKRLGQIADEMTAEGFSGPDGGRLRKRQLYDILTNPILVGTWRAWERSPDIKDRPNMGPSCIEKADYDRVQEIFAQRSGRNGTKRHVQLKYTYVLREPLRCARVKTDGNVCGENFIAQTRKGPKGVPRYEYTHPDRGCRDTAGAPHLSHPEEQLLVQLDHVIEHIELPQDALEIADTCIREELNHQGPSRAQQLERLTNELLRSNISFRRGGYGDNPEVAEADWNRDCREINQKIENLRAEEENFPGAHEAATVLQLRDTWRAAARDEKRQIVEALIERIDVVPANEGKERRVVITNVVPRRRFRVLLSCALEAAMSECVCTHVHSPQIEGLAEFRAWKARRAERQAA